MADIQLSSDECCLNPLLELCYRMCPVRCFPSRFQMVLKSQTSRDVFLCFMMFFLAGIYTENIHLISPKLSNILKKGVGEFSKLSSYTTSGTSKSLICLRICRLFQQRGCMPCVLLVSKEVSVTSCNGRD